MNRKGFALLATLWLLASLSVVAAATLVLARSERDAAIDRIALTKGRLAGEGCLAILQDDLARGRPLAGVDSTDLGSRTWCRATVEDLGGRIGLEIENADLLAALVVDPGQAAALLDWLDADDAPRAEGAETVWYQAQGRRPPRNGPIAAMAELRYVRGFDSLAVARLARFATTWGARRIDPNLAPRELMAALPGLEEAAATLLADHRRRGGRFDDLDGMLRVLPPSLRGEALGHYAELQGRLAFTPERVVVHLEGGVPEVPFTVRTDLLTQVAPGRLAILAREEW